MSKLLLYCFSHQKPGKSIPALDQSSLSWIKVGSIHVATSSLPPEITKNLPEQAFKYQQIAQLLHREIAMIPVPFPTVTDEKELGLLVANREKKISSLIEKYGGMSEHSFYVKPEKPDYEAPDGLQGEQEGLSYLRKKHESFKSDDQLEALVSEISKSIQAVFTSYLEDYECIKGDGFVSIHLLCNKKEGFPSTQLRNFGHTLKESATVKEIDIFPPFHFVDFTTLYSTP